MTRRDGEVTLQDVARVSGVSSATASRALNGRAGVAPEVSRRVNAVAGSLGYRPNAAARSLASGRTGVIGLVMPTDQLVRNEYGALLVHAFVEAASRNGHAVMLWLGRPTPGDTAREIMRGGLIDGLVISGVGFGSPWVEELIDGPRPCVLIGQHPTRPDASVVKLDNEAGARGLVEHLIETGRHRIAMITGPIAYSDSLDRLAGYRAALEAHGLPYDEALIEHGDFLEPTGEMLMRRLLPRVPDAVFAANDGMAAGALRAIAAAGQRVPHDIAVGGFDDMPGSAQLSPALTTVRQDVDAVAAAAIDALAVLVGGGAAVRRVIPTELIVRASTVSAV